MQLHADPQAVQEVVDVFLANIAQRLKMERSVRIKSFGVFTANGGEITFQVSPTLRDYVTIEDVIADVAEAMRENSRLPAAQAPV